MFESVVFALVGERGTGTMFVCWYLEPFESNLHPTSHIIMHVLTARVIRTYVETRKQMRKEDHILYVRCLKL